MRLIVQRVSRVSVSVGGVKVSEAGEGLFVLVGVHMDDTLEKAVLMAEKLVKLRVMADKAGKMNLTVKDTEGEMMVVSQFTLYGDTSGGNRPSFVKAARPEAARPIYERFVHVLRERGEKVQTGRFGEFMHIETELNGPVTIVMEN